MTLRQHCFGRRSLELTSDGAMLHVVSTTWFSRYKYSVRLVDLGPKFDEWSHVAIGWYLVAAAALIFLGFHFRDGWYRDSLGVLVGLIYLSLAAYSVFHAWRRSGSYAVIRAEGETPRAIHVFRQRPSRADVDRFLVALTAEVCRAKAASPAAPP